MGGGSWYKLVVYMLLSAKRRASFCKSIAIEMGGVSRYSFKSIGVRGQCDSPEKSPCSFFGGGAECTTPLHSQSLVNFVATIHSQGISAARTKIASSFAKPFTFASAFLRKARFAVSFVIWGLKFASEFSGRVSIRIRIRCCIAATAVHSGGGDGFPCPSPKKKRKGMTPWN